jgi:chromosome segregation ATPase
MMLDHRLLCVPAILTLLVIPAAAQDQNIKPYSQEEIDSLLGTLRNDVAKEIDAKINAVNSSLADLGKKLDAYQSSLRADTDKKLDTYKSSLADLDKKLDAYKSFLIADTDKKLDTYKSSLADLDKKLDAYKSSLIADTDKKLDTYKSSLMTDTDKKLDADKSSLVADTDKKLDALKSDWQASSYSRKAIDGKFAAITADTNDKVKDLGQREEAEIKALDRRIPIAPWLNAALLGALFGLATSFAFTRYSALKSDAQRRTDEAGSPS